MHENTSAMQISALDCISPIWGTYTVDFNVYLQFLVEYSIHFKDFFLIFSFCYQAERCTGHLNQDIIVAKIGVASLQQKVVRVPLTNKPHQA